MKAVRGKKRQSYLVFRIGAGAFAVPAGGVREVVPLAALARPPGSPGFVAGFLNRSGIAVPVLRLDALLGLEAISIGLYSPIIVATDRSGALLAFVADAVDAVVDVDSDGLLPIDPGMTFNGCAEALLADTDPFAHVLAHDRLLLAAEERAVAAFRAEEQTRLDRLAEAAP